MAAVPASVQELPVLAVAADLRDVDRATVLRCGARDLVSAADPTLVGAVAQRELADLAYRRQGLERHQQLQESEQRVQVLLDSSRDAVAYIHEGVHVYANHAYLELFGYDSVEELEIQPLMNLVVREDRDRLKGCLRRFGRSDAPNEDIEVTGLHADGTGFPLRMEFSRALVHGEACTQVVIRDETAAPEAEPTVDEEPQAR